MEKAVKVCVVGPPGAGKTAAVRFLAEWESGGSEYIPTQGVRIQEVERPGAANKRVQVQLWDCSGDAKYEACWPAMAQEAQGLLMLYDVSNGAPDVEKQLEKWYAAFATPNNLSENRCQIIAVNASAGAPTRQYGMQGKLSRLGHRVVAFSDADTRRGLFTALDTVIEVSVR